MTAHLRTAILGLVALAIVPAAEAGAAESSGAAGKPRHDIMVIAEQAKTVERRIAAEGATVAIVGRIGRDPAELPRGLRFTHVGFWVHSTIREKDAPDAPPLHGYAAYNLYQVEDRPDRSSLRQDFPVEFLSGAYDLSTGVIIPRPELQDALRALIASPAYAQLHNPRYSAVANPALDRFQNCTSFVLDVVMAGVYRTTDKREIKANVAAYFTPQIVEISAGKRLLASIFVREIATGDQGERIRTATWETIAAFMEKYGLSDRSFIVPAPPPRGT